MNHLKIVAKGWEGYTGLIGMHHFKDGVSVEPISRPEIDRLSAVIQMVEIHKNGKEVPAGIAHRLVTDTAKRAPVREAPLMQTEAEKRSEQRRDILRGEKKPVERFYTRAELEAIVEKGGIKALREIAEPWGVKHRNIVALMEELLAAQSKFLEARKQRLTLAGVAPATDEVMAKDVTPVDVESIARACHEANRAYCASIGDDSQPAWEDAPEWQRTSCIDGVKFVIANPDAGDSAQHDNWMKTKIDDGWVYGEVKDPEKKTHPCLVPFDQLPPEQQEKDRIFRRTVLEALAGGKDA